MGCCDFQRLLTVARATENDLMEAFRHELCSIPPALFESNGLLRPANKPVLADAIWILVDNAILVAQGNMQFVLDERCISVRTSMVKGQTYESLCQMYAQHIQKRFGLDSTTLIFYSYPDRLSTKGYARLRHSEDVKGVDVHFTEDKACNSKKQLFCPIHPTNRTLSAC